MVVIISGLRGRMCLRAADDPEGGGQALKTRRMIELARWVALCVPVLLLAACGLAEAPVLDPKGPVAMAERDLLFETLAIMMIVAVPVFIMAFVFAWRFRANGGKGRYDPSWSSSLGIEVVIWAVPAAIIVVLGGYVWVNAHKLDPFKQIDPDVEPLVVEVVAQDWKWLFLYPDHDIATVNELVFPAGMPLTLNITSDTVMNAFFVPALGSQIYAMAGMETHLNLLADEAGQFVGRNSQYSGDGFSQQSFVVRAVSQADFDAWVETVRGAGETLDEATYETLRAPSIAHPVVHYDGFEDGLFDRIIMRYMSPEGHDHSATTN
jgi:cytochrome o ubiquinol oxidase subunit II